ncbi:hypothetical protein A2767_04640 [Candidatus Roizmanbacteria bacterium RIFCSPHIGHO2_01_FULL_35_10]|uniref:HPt domain-containing protein n=1 Tax=Candidatus Roizmanbacteria bacterium RIFCSPLOWO2_01_FULL_35_13 TaxID=1802055 RepID=A0A1F7I722_9BACT|nr:MAG: hypothetical protein A2767_04640 [Candidatus Roizmanbacteria bacterium RIFCSPHIGHO2_01_FULL_35_10]OGK39164.1 MAG: hypothetical protein A3A74_03655 [Candidatus Roizmanbacteria bacterium RIFCSPLOWO2_01_FULL_35_13]
MVHIDLATYKSLYLKTAREHVDNLKKNLELLNTDQSDKKAIFELFRLFHSLKSQNFFMGFEKTAHLCKIFEEFFRQINEGKKMYKTEVSNVVSTGIEKLENSLNLIDKNNSEPDLSPDIINLATKIE